MTEPKTIAENYLAAWNEEGGVERRAILARTWSGQARYVDPLMRGEGCDEIATMIEAARAQFPGHQFKLAGVPDGHGAHVRFSWTLAPVGGETIGGGTDVVRLDRDGRIVEVVGFLDSRGA